MIQGKYYSKKYSTVGANEDLFDKMRTDLGLTSLVAKKLTLICPFEITVDINELGIYSDLFMDLDGFVKLSTSDYNVSVYSLKVKESGISDIFVAIIF